MKKISILILLVVAMLYVTLGAPSAKADDGGNDRTGFFLSIGGNVGAEVNELEKFGGGIVFRIGGGLTDKFLLYYEGNTFFTSKNGFDIMLYDSQAKAQYFVWENLYTNFGVGVTYGRVVIGNLAATTDAGLAISWGLGNDFRIGDMFYIAPEVSLDYRRIEGANLFNPGATVNFGWYF